MNLYLVPVTKSTYVA